MMHEATFDEQYQALRSGCGVVELRDWSSIVVTGADRQKFLNSFCTNDDSRLAVGNSCEAFFLNVKGKIVGHGIVSCRENKLVIVGTPGQAAKLIEHLDRYVIREDVQLHDATTERSYVLIAGGPATDGVLNKVAELASVSVVTIPAPLIGSATEAICEVASGDLLRLQKALADSGVVAANDAFQAARIEAGVPFFHVDFDEYNLPQEVGRDKEAISFTKGCYLGQETVARIDALGHVNQRIVSVRFFREETPALGNELSHNGGAVGRVTSAAFSPALNAPLALAMIRREANTLGTRLTSPAGECEVVATALGR